MIKFTAWNTVVEEIKGEQKVTSVLLKDVKTGEVRDKPSVVSLSMSVWILSVILRQNLVF